MKQVWDSSTIDSMIDAINTLEEENERLKAELAELINTAAKAALSE